MAISLQREERDHRASVFDEKVAVAWASVIGRCTVLSLVVCSSAFAGKVADSTSDYSLVQGQGGWRYGFVAGDGGAGPTSMAGFTDFDTTVSGQWKASAAQVGSQNTVFLGLNVDGGHPNGIGPGAQDTIIWSTRRYVTSRGPVSVVVEFFCTDFLPYNPKAAGATAHVLVNGVEAQSATSRNVDDVPRLAAIVVFDAGAILDFAADPHGAPPFSENEWSARADGFTFHARVYDYPCASAADCGDIGCVFGVCCDPLVHACPDGGVVDSGIADSGVEDAGVGDSGVFDAGGFDAGHDDAGFADAGEVDAGVPDAGSTEPEVVDARIEDRPDNRRLHVGCGCGSVNALLPMVMLALIGFASRRARQRL